jgi:hypothetical protein
VLPQTRAPEIADPPTYGGLLDDVRRTLEVAAGTAVDPADPYPHINGYERFLRNAGANMALLGSFTNHRPDGTGTLQAKLLRLPHHDAGTTAWDDAATRLGAAHDLVATHLGPDNQYRSPEAADLLAQSGGLSATRDVTDLILVAASATSGLVRLAPNHTTDAPPGAHNRFFLTALNRERHHFGVHLPPRPPALAAGCAPGSRTQFHPVARAASDASCHASLAGNPIVLGHLPARMPAARACRREKVCGPRLLPLCAHRRAYRV